MPPPVRFLAFAVLSWLIAAVPLQAHTCKIVPVLTVTLGYAEGLATAQARIDGVEVTLGIDTGAQTLVTPQTASRLHLLRDARHRTREIGATAVTIASNVLIRDFEFAGRHYGPKSVASISLAAPRQATDPPLAGLIGADILSKYDIDFDLASRSMTLYKVAGCARIAPPWTDPYTSFPIRITGERHVVIPVELNGTRLAALLDTGATGMAISRKAALRSGVTEAMLKADPLQELIGVGGIAARQPSHRFRSMVLAGETIHDIPLQLIPTQLPSADVLVGQVYLLFRRVWISYATRTLFVGARKIPPPQQVPEPFVKLFAPTAAPRGPQGPSPMPPQPPAAAREGGTCQPGTSSCEESGKI